MKEFDDFMDLTGKNRILKCYYHGSGDYLHLEGRIVSETGSDLEVGVTLFDFEIDSHQYDSSRKSLDIWYKEYEGATAGLPLKTFKVPKDIQEINVYDK